MKARQFVIATVAAVMFACPAAAAGGPWSVSLGYEHSSGDYGLGSDTDTDYVPLTVSYQDNGWSVDLTVPWIRMEGYGTVVMTRQGPMQMSVSPASGMYSMRGSGRYGMGGTTTTTTTTVRYSESGPGDITLALGRILYGGENGRPTVTLTGTVKFPTADEDKGLGTGETDYGIEAGLTIPLGRLTPFITAGYTVTGDSDTISYNDYFYGSAGCGFAIAGTVEVGAAYSANGRLTDQGDDGRSVSAYLDAGLDDTWSLSLSVAAGLSDATADTTYAVGLTASF